MEVATSNSVGPMWKVVVTILLIEQPLFFFYKDLSCIIFNSSLFCHLPMQVLMASSSGMSQRPLSDYEGMQPFLMPPSTNVQVIGLKTQRYSYVGLLFFGGLAFIRPRPFWLIGVREDLTNG